MIMTLSETTKLWEKTLKKVKEKLDNQNIFDYFFANTYIHEIKGDTIIVVADKLVAKIELNSKYKDLLE